MDGSTLTSLPFSDDLLLSIDLSVYPLSVISLTSSSPAQAGQGKTGQTKLGSLIFIYIIHILGNHAQALLRTVGVSIRYVLVPVR